jgi:hypothetical protein
MKKALIIFAVFLSSCTRVRTPLIITEVKSTGDGKYEIRINHDEDILIFTDKKCNVGDTFTVKNK